MRRLLLIHAAIGAAILFYYPPTTAQQVVVSSSDNAEDKYNPDNPESWEWEARIKTRSLIAAVDYDNEMLKAYNRASARCPDSEGMDGWFMWLGRVNPQGFITKTYTTSKSEFPLCLDRQLRAMRVKRPPKWHAPGYPVMFMYGPPRKSSDEGK